MSVLHRNPAARPVLGSTVDPGAGRGLLLPAQFAADDATAVVRRRLPGCRIERVTAAHHEYAGFIHRVDFGGRADCRGERHVRTLVDLAAGSALLAPPFDRIGAVGERPEGPVTGVAEAAAASPEALAPVDAGESIARRLVETATMRRSRLGRAFDVALVDAVRRVWKPNWLVTAEWRGRRLRVLVDGLSGEHWSE